MVRILVYNLFDISNKLRYSVFSYGLLYHGIWILYTVSLVQYRMSSARGKVSSKDEPITEVCGNLEETS